MALGFGFDLMSQAVRQRPWTPRFLFGDGEQGAWYDPSDFATLYQDSAGTTPVTALGQPVGLMLDKSQGGKPTGPNIFTGTGWTLPTGWAYANGELTYDGSGTINSRAYIPITFSAGVSHVVTFTVEQRTGIFGVAWATAGAAGTLLSLPTIASTEPYQAIAVPQGAVLYFQVLTATNTLRISNISVREIPGNHAAQGTAAARPTVQARVNLLERSEEFDNGYWSKASATITPNTSTAPDGTSTADTFASATTGYVIKRNATFLTNGITYTSSIYVRAKNTSGVVRLAVNDISDIPIASQDYNVTTDWQRIAFTFTASASSAAVTLIQRISGDNEYFCWGAQLELGSTATTYQRVTTATDYADIGLPRYLEFDGVDDFMELSGSSLGMFNDVPAMSLVLGSRSLTSSTQAILFVGSGTSLTRAQVTTSSVISAGGRRLDADSFASVNDSTSADALQDHVISSLFRTFDAKLALRVDGNQTLLDPFQTAGNTSATDSFQIRIAISGSTEAAARFYQIIMRNADIAGALLDQTERFVARKTGVTL